MVWISRLSSTSMRKKKKWKEVLPMGGRGGNNLGIQAGGTLEPVGTLEPAGFCWGKCRKTRLDIQRNFCSKNSFSTLNYEETTQAAKERFLVDCLDFSLWVCWVGFPQSNKSAYSNFVIYSCFCFVFSQTWWFPCKRSCFPWALLIEVPL